ncbi:L,D-transpeptidase family protein [Pedobacter sp. P351]|uniref:L,D-transpeptidase family protein n=1 Tax=Pedobacter superstes TaxID=3133441 RepID=UPI003097FBD0
MSTKLLGKVTGFSNKGFYIIAFIFLFLAVSSCKNKVTLGDQPTLDSVYITNYMKSDPEFKEHLDWAKKFYKERKFTLGWFKNHELVPQAKKMFSVINKSDEEGLDPKDYQLFNLDEKLKELDEAKKDTAKFNDLEKKLDIALSATYFNFADDYYRGLVVPRENKGVEWDVKRNKIKLHKALLTLLGARKSKYPYAEFQPLHPEYSNLKKALAHYRQIQKAGGWPVIPENTRLKSGQSSPVVAVLNKRLQDFLPKDQDSAVSADSTVYGPNLVSAVKKFQVLHGQNPDGNIGPSTVKLLNVPVQNRIRQIIINMERWRWIPKSFEPSYLFVNIPEYKLHVIENSKEVMSMNVIVGKTLHETPIFSDRLEYVVLSPYWNIPPNILRDEIAPKAMSDPGFLDRMDMEVVTDKGSPVSASSVDWSQAGTDGFGYIVRRRPGPKNDLGDVKFIFPNENNIYLHDTPHDELFSQAKRGFSHGCVRVERPLELATYLLRNVSGWDQSNIMNQISTRKEKYVPVKEKLPVYLLYFTAKADASGHVQFYEDIYGHDSQLASRYFSKL